MIVAVTLSVIIVSLSVTWYDPVILVVPCFNAVIVFVLSILAIVASATASTSEANMPQTGENDTAKIAGIIVFSIIGMVSFYKYKESCKSESM